MHVKPCVFYSKHEFMHSLCQLTAVVAHSAKQTVKCLTANCIPAGNMMSFTRLAMLTLPTIGTVSARDLLETSIQTCGSLGLECCVVRRPTHLANYDMCGGPDSGLVCLNRKCVKCGKANTPVCISSHHCDENLDISPDNFCVCGGTWTPV
jgi:hypothetical protein